MKTTQIIGACVIYGEPIETVHEIIFSPVFDVLNYDAETADIYSSVKQIYNKFGIKGVTDGYWTAFSLNKHIPKDVGYDMLEIIFEVLTEGKKMVNPFDCIYKMGKHPSDYPFTIMSVSVIDILEDTDQVVEIKTFRNHPVGLPNYALRFEPTL